MNKASLLGTVRQWRIFPWAIFDQLLNRIKGRIELSNHVPSVIFTFTRDKINSGRRDNGHSGNGVIFGTMAARGPRWERRWAPPAATRPPSCATNVLQLYRRRDATRRLIQQIALIWWTRYVIRRITRDVGRGAAAAATDCVADPPCSTLYTTAARTQAIRPSIYSSLISF